MKKKFVVFLSLFLIAAFVSPVFGAGTPPDTSAYTRLFVARHAEPSLEMSDVDTLRRLDLLKGTEKGYELDRGMTRMEALVTVIRLSGFENEALSQNIGSDFSDIPDWASAYAGFGQTMGLARGVGGDRFGANDPVTAKQYATMMLRLLGYDDAAGAFSYEEVLDFAYEAELIDEWDKRHYEEKETAGVAFLRGDAIYFMRNALRAPMAKGSAYSSVIAKLYTEERIDREKAAGTMIARGETEKEIVRALENGYSEVWLETVTEALRENASISSDEIRNIFENSLYNWSKEAGSAISADRFAHSLRNLKVGFASARRDALFRVNPEIAAYYSYPNRIVIRSDLDAGRIASSLTHEFRHALSANIGLTVLEEGVTELWNQEVEGGYYAYPYYFVNFAKFIFHMAGAEAANKGDLTGDYEELFYALEKESGVDVNNVELYLLLAAVSPSIEESVMNPDDAFLEKLSEINEIFLAVARGHYANNIEERVAESANYEAFVDRILALGQLLYYPSSMIREADSDDVKNPPSAYYDEAFYDFAREAILLYGDATGLDADPILRYFEENKDRRFCLEYLGKNAGRMFVKEGTGYRVTQRSGRNLYYSDFGTKADADKFAAAIDAVSVEALAGMGFVLKNY
jgi:hypothetical protein